MAKIRDEVRERAIELRRKGETLNKIQEILVSEFDEKVSLGSISTWAKKSTATVIKTGKNGEFEKTKTMKLNENRLNDPEYLIRKHGLDPTQVEMTSHTYKEWEAQSKENGVIKMYSSGIKVKPIKGAVSSDIWKDIIDGYVEGREYSESFEYNLGREYAILEVRDLHLGLLSWIEEVGENYDTKIASKFYLGCIQYFVDKLKERGNTKQILLVTGDDFFHYDNIAETTTAGTPQDSDVRWAKMFTLGMGLLEKSIEMLAEVAPVHVPYIGGNHDEMTSFHAYYALNKYFKDSEDITVDITPRTRKYFKLGNTALGVTHGTMSKKQLTGVMPDEASSLYASCRYKEMHMGHLHSEQTDEHGGVIYRWNPTLTGASRWEHNKGYKSQTASLMYIYDEEMGLTTIEKFKPEMVKDIELLEALKKDKEQDNIIEL